MASSVFLRWSLTAVFGVLGGYCLLRCCLPALTHAGHLLSELVSDAAHLAMSAAMIAMLWALTRGDPWGVQMAIFAVATGWYLVRAADARHDTRHRLGLAHQGVAMAAMFWMYGQMMAPGGAMRMPGMTMSGTAMTGTGMADMGMQGTATSGTGHSFWPLAGPWVTVAFAGYLALAALWWLWQGVVTAVAQRAAVGAGAPGVGAAGGTGVGGGAGPAVRLLFGPLGEAGGQTLMAAAMSVALLATW